MPWDRITAKPDVTADTVYVACRDQKLYAFDRTSGEVLATRYPIRTRHDVQIWRNVTSGKELQKLGFAAGSEAEEGRILSFFLYARKHKGAIAYRKVAQQLIEMKPEAAEAVEGAE